ncbi:MAG: hypothetical protein Q9218_004451 [Villophora microphyllina]
MAFQPLLRQRAVVPTAIAATAFTTLLYPRTTVHAEAPPSQTQLTRKPIYDDLPPLRQKPDQPTQNSSSSPSPTTSPTPTDRLASQIKRARLSIQQYSTDAESRFNALMSTLLHGERTFTSTIASLAPPPQSNEHLMPGALYVLHNLPQPQHPPPRHGAGGSRGGSSVGGAAVYDEECWGSGVGV